MESKKTDFFISHASEDKDRLAKPLTQELQKRGFKVWYDEFSLKIGETIIKSIEEGIKNSYYGIVILSKDFFKKRWPLEELNALSSKEFLVKENIIIPIWHEVSDKEVFNFSPFLAGRYSLKSDLSIKLIADSIQEIASFRITTAVMMRAKIEELKSCTLDQKKKEAIDIVYRLDQIFLFEEAWRNYRDEYINIHGFDVLDENLGEIEIKKIYEIPITVYTKDEPYETYNLNLAKKLCKNWVDRKMSEEKCYELMNLLDEFMDTDLTYILYGFPEGTIKNGDVYKLALNGILEIGNKIRSIKKDYTPNVKAR